MAASDNLHPQQFKLPLDYYREQHDVWPHDVAVAREPTTPLDIWRKRGIKASQLREKLVNDPRSGAHEL